jgi:hypothetical protein
VRTLGADTLAEPNAGGFVITRLHARYSKDALGDDLFFRAAPPIVGGREFMQNGAALEQGARPAAQNNFQARYAIRHPWTGAIACSNPQRGIWGGPPDGREPVQAAAKIGFSRRGGAVTLATFVHGTTPPETFLSNGGTTPVLAIPATTPADVDASASLPDASVAEGGASGVDWATAHGDGVPAPPSTAPPPTPPPQGGCGGCSAAPSGGDFAAASLFALAFVAMTRRKR